MRPEAFVFPSNAARVSQKVGHPWSKNYLGKGCVQKEKQPLSRKKVLYFVSKTHISKYFVLCIENTCFDKVSCPSL